MQTDFALQSSLRGTGISDQQKDLFPSSRVDLAEWMRLIEAVKSSRDWEERMYNTKSNQFLVVVCLFGLTFLYLHLPLVSVSGLSGMAAMVSSAVPLFRLADKHRVQRGRYDSILLDLISTFSSASQCQGQMDEGEKQRVTKRLVALASQYPLPISWWVKLREKAFISKNHLN